MAFNSRYDAVDAALSSTGLPSGGPPLATAATVLLGNDGAVTSAGEIVNFSVPLTAFSINANLFSQNELFAINPAGTLATGTYVFPSDAKSRIGQEIRIISTQTQTALTLTTTGLTMLGTAVTALVANTAVAFKKVAAATWQRIV